MQVCQISAELSAHFDYDVWLDEFHYRTHLPTHFAIQIHITHSEILSLLSYVAGILRVHHYIGSFEQYSSRSDVRRTKEKFDDFGNVSNGTDYQMQKWLKNFVDIVGVKKSIDLLKDAGIIDVGTTQIIEKEEYEIVPPPPVYYVYYYDSKGNLTEKKLLNRHNYKKISNQVLADSQLAKDTIYETMK